ncbi:hypothetical protein GQ44DRAFT_778284 [Phaeosphaeriaceae sp. PMI808]|nr:hypothetical protein GQ44DRAFT_778284 [Phaeosphaeriaceae sp. PMI808]
MAKDIVHVKEGPFVWTDDRVYNPLPDLRIQLVSKQNELREKVPVLKHKTKWFEEVKPLVDLLQSSHIYLKSQHAALKKEWTRQEKHRKKEKKRKEEGLKGLLQTIAIRTIVVLGGCWIAQWVWWVGYIRVADQAYCPPKLGKIATIWILFSMFGAMLGGSI